MFTPGTLDLKSQKCSPKCGVPATWWKYCSIRPIRQLRSLKKRNLPDPLRGGGGKQCWTCQFRATEAVRHSLLIFSKKHAPGYPLVNDHIASWNDIPIFNRKYIDSIRVHFPASYVSLPEFMSFLSVRAFSDAPNTQQITTLKLG